MKNFTRVVQFLVIATLFLIGSSYATNYYYVNDNSTTGDVYTTAIGNDGNPGTSVAPFATINHAISVAIAGDVIYVDAGTYSESDNTIAINKTITLLGPNDVISPNGGVRVAEAILTSQGLNVSPHTVISISAGAVTVTIKGFKFDGTLAPAVPGTSVILSYNTGIAVDIEKNIFANIAFDPMYFEAPPTFIFDDNLLTNIGNTSGDPIQMGGNYNGITGTSVTITNNVWENSLSSGMNMSNVTGTISNNQFTHIQYYGILVANQCGNLTISNNTFDHITNPDTVGVPSYGAGVRTYDQNYTGPISVTNNTFTDSYIGFVVRSGSIVGQTINVNNNSFSGNRFGVRNLGTGTLDATNNWWGNATGPQNATTNPSGTGDEVSDNVDYSPWWGANYISVAHPWTWYVNPSNSSTIQEGIDAASSSDTIKVAAGTYAEHITINKSLTIRGPNYLISPRTGTRVPEATISGTGADCSIDIQASANPVTITGFEFTGNNTFAAIFVHNDHATISKNWFNAIQGMAVQQNVSFSDLVSNQTVDDNKINNITGTSNSGIYYDYIANSTISNNYINTTPYAGIILTTNSNNVTISGNSVSNVPKQGIEVAGIATGVTINNNTINHADTTSGADRGGIRLYGSAFTGTVTVTNNVVTNSYNGLAIKNGENITGKDIHVHDNTFSSNSNMGVYHGGTGTLDATNNWWGSIYGPKVATNPGGQGDSVSANVDYRPWTGMPSQVTVDTADLNHPINIPGTDVTLNFTSFPDSTNAQINVSQIPGLPNGTPPPPGDTSQAPVLLEISATGLTNYTFNVQVTIDVSSIPGFNASTVVMRFDTQSNSWVIVNGTYMAHNPAYGGDPTFTFSTDHFSVYAFVTLSGLYTVSLGNISTYTGSSVFVPVKINLNGNGGINELQGRFSFDPAKLQYQTAFYGTGTLVNQEGWVVYFQQTSPGVVDMIGVGVNPIDSVSLVSTDSLLFKLVFRVVATSGGQTIISADTAHFFANETPHLFNAVQDTITYTTPPPPVKGDANGDYVVDMNDVIYLQDYFDGMVTLTQQDSINADIDGNGHIDSWDVQAILYFILHGTWLTPPSPAIASSGSIMFTSTNYDKHGLLTLPINISGASNVYRLDLYLRYDASKISYQTFKQSILSAGYFVNATELSSGYAKFVFTSGVMNHGNINPGNIVLKIANLTKALGSQINTEFRINGGQLVTGPSVVLGVTGIEQPNVTPVIPKDFSVSQNYPNPFNPSTTIQYALPKSSLVTIKIYNILGQEVRTLLNTEKPAGNYMVQWNGDNNFGQQVSTGTYIYRVVAGQFVKTMKMILLK